MFDKQSNISYIKTRRSEKDYMNAAENYVYHEPSQAPTDGEPRLIIIFRILWKPLTPILKSI
jgi:hypothetical protein